MNESGRKEGFKTDKLQKLKWNKDTFLIIVLVGILLFIIALPMENRKTDSAPAEEKQISQEEKKETSVSNAEMYSSKEMLYARQLEEELENALQYMEGVGKAKVMITIKSSEEQIIEKDNNNTRSGTTESDSEGGTRSANEMSNEMITIFEKDENGNEKPYVVKKILPNIEGIVIVAQGGGNLTVSKNITEAVEALFGIEVHKIKVVKMKS